MSWTSLPGGKSDDVSLVWCGGKDFWKGKLRAESSNTVGDKECQQQYTYRGSPRGSKTTKIED